MNVTIPASTHENFVREFSDLYHARLRADELRLKRKLTSHEITVIRSTIRERLRQQYPNIVADLDHYHETNARYWRENGGVRMGKPKNKDAQYKRGEETDRQLRGQTNVMRAEIKRLPDEPRIGRPEKKNKRYMSLVESYGYVPPDSVAAKLLGIAQYDAAALRMSLAERFDLTPAEDNNAPDAARRYWLATPKPTVDPNIAKLRQLVDTIDPATRATLVELLQQNK